MLFLLRLIWKLFYGCVSCPFMFLNWLWQKHIAKKQQQNYERKYCMLFLLRLIWKLFYGCVSCPFMFLNWLWQKHIAKKQRQNYELLGIYISYFQNKPAILRTLTEMIEKGISQKKFEGILRERAVIVQKERLAMEQKQIMLQNQEKESMLQIIKEQQELLAQSKMNFEQLKFREQVLDDLYNKAELKYKNELQEED